MILIVDLCYRKDSLSRDEFVGPIAGIVKGEGFPFTVKHFSEVEARDLAAAEKVILCGTALKDNAFIQQSEHFHWISGYTRPILGICAGMQILSVAFGGGVERNCEIGMTEIRLVKSDPLFSGKDTFSAYELHTFSALPPAAFAVVAVSEQCVQAIRHLNLPIYGVMFHPEVRNEWIVRRFLGASLACGGDI
jgi:GMP synthase-like glutamine amidotransferase